MRGRAFRYSHKPLTISFQRISQHSYASDEPLTFLHSTCDSSAEILTLFDRFIAAKIRHADLLFIDIFHPYAPSV